MPAQGAQGPQTNRLTNRKHPGDMTGRADEQAKKAIADAQKIEQAGVTMADSNNPISHILDNVQSVVDYTDDARPKVEPKPVAPVAPAEPKKYRIRVVAGIDNMTFGKEIISSGDFTDPDHPIMPIIGSLKTYSFEEGRQYIVDEPLYIHLRDLGYLYGE